MTTALALAEPTSDPESLDWVRVLTATGRVHDDAVERLHALMLRAARFEVSRRTAGFAPGSDDLDDLAMRAADDALVALLNKLHTYRGDSRFTTWAYKFALLEAGVKVRRRPWHGREVTLDEDGLARLPSHERASPAQEVETFELLRRRPRRDHPGANATAARGTCGRNTERRPDRRARQTEGHDARRAVQDLARRPPQAAHQTCRRGPRGAVSTPPRMDVLPHGRGPRQG